MTDTHFRCSADHRVAYQHERSAASVRFESHHRLSRNPSWEGGLPHQAISGPTSGDYDSFTYHPVTSTITSALPLLT